MTQLSRIRWTFVAVLIFATRFSGTAQNLRVDVLLQQVITTVRDSEGKLVMNLLPEHFIVEMNGVRQPIAHFKQDKDVLISVGLVIDSSQSMEAALSAARGAASTFIGGMRVKDESFLMTFDGRATMRQNFTSEPARLFEALRGVKIGFGTYLIDAVNEAAGQMRHAKNPKRALIVISDGGDNFANDWAIEAFKKRVAGMETLLYAVQLQDSREAARLAREARLAGANDRTAQDRDPNDPNPADTRLPGGNTAMVRPALAQRLMQVMADESGARYFYIDSNTSPNELSRQMSSIFDEIFTELRGQYTIGFYPPPNTKAPSQVRLKTTDESFRVRTMTTRMNRSSDVTDAAYEYSLRLGQDHERLGQVDKAIYAYEYASKLKPSDPRAFLALAKLQAQEKELRKASEALNQPQKLNALNGPERYLFAAVLFELGDSAGAERQCAEAIALMPDNPQPYLLAYSVYLKRNKRQEALNILDRYLQRFPDDPNRELAIERARKLRAALSPDR